MKRVRLIHWNVDEAGECRDRLNAEGYRVEWEPRPAPDLFPPRAMTDSPQADTHAAPDLAFVICAEHGVLEQPSALVTTNV